MWATTSGSLVNGALKLPPVLRRGKRTFQDSANLKCDSDGISSPALLRFHSRGVIGYSFTSRKVNSDSGRFSDGSMLWNEIVSSASNDSKIASSPTSSGRAISNDVEYEDRFLYFLKGGGELTAQVQRLPDKFVMYFKITTDNPIFHSTERQPLLLHWGLFRSDRSSWVVLDPEEVPKDTVFVQHGEEAMRTPWIRDSGGNFTLTLELPADLAPFAVNSVLFWNPSASDTHDGHWLRSTKDANFCIPIGYNIGFPYPLGSTFRKDKSVNFAVYAKAAEGVTLCLYEGENPEPSMEIDLEPSLHRTGDTWHIGLKDVRRFNRYGYRVKGELSWERGSRFHSRQILLDPYANGIATPVPGQVDFPSPAAALGLIQGAEDSAFNWEEDFPPRIPLEETFAYRMSVPGFTQGINSGVPEKLRGTFLGVLEKVDHILSLGVNCVILQPIATYDETQGPHFPYNFFTPMATYSPTGDQKSAIFGLKQLVKELHKKGIEVVLEVVYSNTAEKNDDEPKHISFRGIDNATYYVMDEFGSPVVPSSGAPNLFNCNNPVTQQLILSSLRHWVTEFHVDGFVFLNASSLLIGPHGQELSRPPIMESIAFDPLLADAKMIADPTGGTTGLVLPPLAELPHWSRWQEINGLFSMDIRRFIRGEADQMSGLATRLCGSGDIFSTGRGPSFGFNSITSLYGLTLADLVSYSNDDEFSWNCGEDGATDNFLVTECRKRQIRNFLSLLFLCQGVPVLSMGDEVGISKGGQTSVEDIAFPWEASGDHFWREVIGFVRSLASFRVRRKNILQRREFLNPEQLRWHGYFPDQPQWENPECRFLAVSLQEEMPGGVRADVDNLLLGDLYLAMNSHHHPVTAHLPDPPAGMQWFRVLDTNLEPAEVYTLKGPEIPSFFGEDNIERRLYDMQAYSVLVLEARCAVPLEPAERLAPKENFAAFKPY